MDQNLAPTSLEGTLAFGRMAVRSGALFNGGALIALIPIAANQYDRISSLAPTIKVEETMILENLSCAAYAFVVGLFLSGIAAIFAFFAEFNYTNFHITTEANLKTKAHKLTFAASIVIVASLIAFAVGACRSINSFQVS